MDQQLHYERKQNEAQWDLGYLCGCTDGFTDALNLIDPLKKSREEGQPPSTSPHEDPDEREARQLHQAMEESKLTRQSEPIHPWCRPVAHPISCGLMPAISRPVLTSALSPCC